MPTPSLIDSLVPLAQELASQNRDGITVADVREAALERGLMTGEESPRELAALGHLMSRAGLVNVGTTRGRQTVWFEDISLEAI